MERTRSTLLAAAAIRRARCPCRPAGSRATGVRRWRPSSLARPPARPAWRRFPGDAAAPAAVGASVSVTRCAVHCMAGEKQGSVPMRSAVAARGCARRRWAWMPAGPGGRRARGSDAEAAPLSAPSGTGWPSSVVCPLARPGPAGSRSCGGVGLERDLHLRRCAQDGAVAGAGALGLGVRDGAFSRRVVIAFGALLRAAGDAECRAGQQRHDVEFAGRVEVSSRAVIMAAYP